MIYLFGLALTFVIAGFGIGVALAPHTCPAHLTVPIPWGLAAK